MKYGNCATTRPRSELHPPQSFKRQNGLKGMLGEMVSKEGDKGIRARWSVKGSRRDWQRRIASEGPSPEAAWVTWVIPAKGGQSMAHEGTKSHGS